MLSAKRHANPVAVTMHGGTVIVRMLACSYKHCCLGYWTVSTAVDCLVLSVRDAK